MKTFFLQITFLYNQFENWFEKHCGWFFTNGMKQQDTKVSLSLRERIQVLDNCGVRVFVVYAQQSGTWGIECYRKKRKDESKGEGDWRMVKEIFYPTFLSREEAELNAVKFGEEIAELNGFK